MKIQCRTTRQRWREREKKSVLLHENLTNYRSSETEWRQCEIRSVVRTMPFHIKIAKCNDDEKEQKKIIEQQHNFAALYISGYCECSINRSPIGSGAAACKKVEKQFTIDKIIPHYLSDSIRNGINSPNVFCACPLCLHLVVLHRDCSCSGDDSSSREEQWTNISESDNYYCYCILQSIRCVWGVWALCSRSGDVQMNSANESCFWFCSGRAWHMVRRITNVILSFPIPNADVTVAFDFFLSRALRIALDSWISRTFSNAEN